MGIDLRCGQALVSQQLLDYAQVRSAIEQVRGEAMAQRVGRDPFRQSGSYTQSLQPVSHSPDPERVAEVIEEEHTRVRAVSRALNISPGVAACARRAFRQNRPSLVEISRNRRPGRPSEQ